MNRICKECNSSEAERTFPPRGTLCKDCRTIYNREYQRSRRGSHPRTKMTPEQKRIRDNERHRNWVKDNPASAKAIRDRCYQKDPKKQIERAKQWKKDNPEWRRP